LFAGRKIAKTTQKRLTLRTVSPIIKLLEIEVDVISFVQFIAKCDVMTLVADKWRSLLIAGDDDKVYDKKAQHYAEDRQQSSI